MVQLSELDLEAEIVGRIELLEIETSQGPMRFVLGDEGRFTDTDGLTWIGSRLIALSSVDFSINGTAPETVATFSFIQDPDGPDLITEIQNAGGADAVKGQKARLWFQYIGKTSEFFAPVSGKVLIFERVCQNLTFSFEGPQQRSVALTIEGPFNLRARPVGGRYTTDEHARRLGVASNPSLEFMPTTATDEQALFGL